MNLKKHLEESRDEARGFTVEHPESSEVGFNEGYLFALNWVLMLVEQNEAAGLDFYGKPVSGGGAK